MEAGDPAREITSAGQEQTGESDVSGVRAVASTLPSECLASPVRTRPLGDLTPRRTNPLVHPHYPRGSGERGGDESQRNSGLVVRILEKRIETAIANESERALRSTVTPSRGDDKTVQAKSLSDRAISFEVGSEPNEHLDVWDFFRADVYAEMAHKVLPEIRERDGRHGTFEAAGKKKALGTRRHRCVGAP